MIVHVYDIGCWVFIFKENWIKLKDIQEEDDDKVEKKIEFKDEKFRKKKIE